MHINSAKNRPSTIDRFEIRRRSVVVFVLIYALVLLNSPNAVNAQLSYYDNNVDGDSNVDFVSNIGDDGNTRYQDAKSLEGDFQEIMEENISEIAYIEDYVDEMVDIDSTPSIGSIADFTNLQDVNAPESQFIEESISHNWGQTTVGTQILAANFMRCMSGSFSLGDSFQVSEIHVLSDTSDSYARLSVYQGGNLTDPDGADLIWDAGTVKAEDGFVGVTGGSASLDNDEPIWICLKGNDATFNTYYDSTYVNSDFQSTLGRVHLPSHSFDENVPFESTINSTGNAFGAFWYSFYIVIESTDLNQEVQFTNVIDYLPSETLAIKTGDFNDSESISVTYRSGLDWIPIGDLTENSWNNYTISLTETTFTIKFGGSQTSSDIIVDSWNIDAILLVVAGLGDDEISVTHDLSDIDASPDIGSIDVLSNLQSKDNTFSNIGEDIPSSILFQHASGSIGTSHSIDIGQPNNNRLVAVFVGNESAGLSYSGVTIDGKSAVKIGEADNSVGLGNHQELWILTESGLGSSSGTVTVTAAGGDNNIAVHVMLFYNVKDSLVPYDVQIDETSVAQMEIVPAPIDVPSNGLLIFGAGNGASGSYVNVDWDTSPTEVTDDGLLPEIELIEAHDASYPTSAILAEAYWISTTTDQTDRQFRAGGSIVNNRGTGIIASFEPAPYRVDQELQWNDIPSDMYSEELAIYTGDLADEDILVDYWNGTNWNNLFTDLIANTWNNISITTILNSNTFTIRFHDGNTILDNIQSNWQIDIISIAYHSTNTHYKLEWEHQAKQVDDEREVFEITIYGYSSNASETFAVQVWNETSSSWLEPLSMQIGETLGWYNETISGEGIISSTITWRYVGNSDQPYDLEQTTLFIDYAGIASYDEAPIFIETPVDITIPEGSYNHVLSWKAYDLNPDYYVIEESETILYEIGNWNNAENISLTIDGLEKGEYIYTITLRDIHGYISEDTVIVNVIDTTSPLFDAVPDDRTYSEGSLENTLTWAVFDKWSDTFELYQDGILTDEIGAWNNGLNVTVNIDGLTMGSYNFTLMVRDESGNIASDTVLVTVIDTTSPEILPDHSDKMFSEGAQGNILTWNATDNYPSTYQIYQNGTFTGENGVWDNANNITINIDFLTKGFYNYTIIIEDTSGNIASSILLVNIFDNTSPVILESSGNLLYGQGYIGNFIWWNASDNYPSNYTVYLDGFMYTSGNWTDKEILLINVDRLPAGEYNFTIMIWDDSENYSTSAIIVTSVAENISPVFSVTPTDAFYIEGSTGNSLNWTATDDFPFIYRIYINGSNTVLNLWAKNVPIILDIDGLELGANNITIVIQDLSRNSVAYTVFITVLDDVNPNIIENPADIEYIVGSSGNSLTLQAYDKHPSHYEVYLDQDLFQEGTWVNSQVISINVNGLPIGSYNFTITVFDSSFNYVPYEVSVVVIYVRTEIENVQPVTEAYEGFIDSITGIWIDENRDVVDLGIVNGQLREEGSNEISEFSGSIVEGAIIINVDYSNLQPGEYVLVLVFEKASYQNHTLSFDVTILSHQLEIHVDFENELVPNSNFTIEISVNYVDPVTSNLGLNDFGSKTGGANNIPLSVNFDLEYQNGTVKTLNYQLTTDSTGLAYVTLSEDQTMNLRSIQGIKVIIKDQGAISGKEENVPHERIPKISINQRDDQAEINLPIFGSINRRVFWILLALISILTASPLFRKYRKQREIEFVKISADLAVAGAEIRGIRSIQQIIIINNGGLPLYVKQIQSVGVDPLLLSGMSSAVSSFLQEVSDQQYFGIQVMENQGLSITSHKTELSNFIIISANSLPMTILDQIKDAHLMIEKKFEKNLKKKFQNQLNNIEVEELMAEAKFKVNLTENLFIVKSNQVKFIKETTNNKDLKLLISTLVDSVEDESDMLTLGELFEFYREKGYSQNEISNIVLTAFNFGILQAKRIV